MSSRLASAALAAAALLVAAWAPRARAQDLVMGSNGALSLQGDDDDAATKPSESAIPGNYHALPLSLDVAWRPCLDCSGRAPWNTGLSQVPGRLSAWGGGVWQPWAGSSPIVGGGVEWIFTENREPGARTHLLMPELRAGWNFHALAVYGDAAWIPAGDGHRAGLHWGVGTSSIAMLALGACVGYVLPSVIELGWDVAPREPARFGVKVGWGF